MILKYSWMDEVRNDKNQEIILIALFLYDLCQKLVIFSGKTNLHNAPSLSPIMYLLNDRNLTIRNVNILL